MKAAHLFVVFLTALGESSLLAQLAAPQIGIVSDLEGALRPVFGVSGNFRLGDPLAQSVVSAGFAGTFTFVKTESHLSILNGATQTDFSAPPGPALFSFSGSTGFVYFVSTRAIGRWDGTSLTDLALDVFEGEALALAQPDAAHVWLAVRQAGQQVQVLLFDGATGTLQSSTLLTTAAGSLALLNEREFVYSNEHGLVLHRADGVEIALAAPELGPRTRLQFEQFGKNWLSVKGNGGFHFAVRTDPGRECLYRLPENAQAENRQ